MSKTIDATVTREITVLPSVVLAKDVARELAESIGKTFEPMRAKLSVDECDTLDNITAQLVAMNVSYSHADFFEEFVLSFEKWHTEQGWAEAFERVGVFVDLAPGEKLRVSADDLAKIVESIKARFDKAQRGRSKILRFANAITFAPPAPPRTDPAPALEKEEVTS